MNIFINILSNIISWTGWSKDDWVEFLMLIPYAFLWIIFFPVRLFIKGMEKTYDFVNDYEPSANSL